VLLRPRSLRPVFFTPRCSSYALFRRRSTPQLHRWRSSCGQSACSRG
jgi:hypothetical protein